MSSIFGKQTVAEPPFDLLLERNQGVDTTYELRKYGKRFAATCAYSSNGSNNDMNSPFEALARYIGVFGQAQNEGGEKISMTAPVVTSGTKIDMTAPVVTQNNGSGEKVMKFMLPVEYDELSKIPKPLDPSIAIEEIPPQTGAVHRYNGSWDESRNKGIAVCLGQQLIHDGVNITEDYVLDHWQFWGYNPPFTIPYFRRNEVWIELGSEEVDYLVENYSIKVIDEAGSLAMVARPLFSFDSLSPLGVAGLVILACTAGFLIKSRHSRYSRL
ncbi:hypothetical protein ACHAXN_010800 [Cyclotella atomus]|jgi:hypothetical protein